MKRSYRAALQLGLPLHADTGPVYLTVSNRTWPALVPRRGNVDKKAATDGPRVAIQATNHTFCSGAVANGS